jgi:hypothetical protein
MKTCAPNSKPHPSNTEHDRLSTLEEERKQLKAKLYAMQKLKNPKKKELTPVWVEPGKQEV